MLRRLIGIILGEIIWESSNWQHINRLKITILGANWQLFRLERIAKCSYFILSTQNIKFHWIVMKIKKFLLPIWWYNRDLFPRSNKYNVVFVLSGLSSICHVTLQKKYKKFIIDCLALQAIPCQLHNLEAIASSESALTRFCNVALAQSRLAEVHSRYPVRILF